MEKRVIMSMDLKKEAIVNESYIIPESYSFKYIKKNSKQLSELLYLAYKDTADDVGESLNDWKIEIDETFHNKYGNIIPELTFGLYIHNKLVGILISSIYKNKPLILYVAIHPEYKGQGLSKILLKKSINNSKQLRKLKKLYLVVSLDNIPAYKLYKKMNFIERADNWIELIDE